MATRRTIDFSWIFQNYSEAECSRSLNGHISNTHISHTLQRIRLTPSRRRRHEEEDDENGAGAFGWALNSNRLTTTYDGKEILDGITKVRASWKSSRSPRLQIAHAPVPLLVLDLFASYRLPASYRAGDSEAALVRLRLIC